jgi:hypothetical protein
MIRPLVITAMLIGLPACASMLPAGEVIPAPTRDWRAVATEADRDRLREWRTAFVAALAKSRAGGNSAEIAREGVLLEPDSSIGGVPIPNGRYKCRTIKLGAKSEGLLDYVAYPAFDCRIRQEKELQGFAKMTGSQRHIGLIFPGDAMRQVLLGTLVLGDEARAMQYGRDLDRDVAGYIERIGPDRWRLILPYPRFESLTDVLELTPAQ